MTSEDVASKAKTSLQFTEVILSRMENPVFVVDGDYRIAFLNDPGELLPTRHLGGERCYEILVESNHPCEGCSLRATLCGHTTHPEQLMRPNGKCYQVSSSPLVCEDGTHLCLAVARSITGINQRGRDSEKRQPKTRLLPLEMPVSQTTCASLDNLLGESKPWLAVKALIQKLASYPTVTVLLIGETGTGKELVAQALHAATFGKDAPFVPLNCAAIPDDLLESEIFGYEQGAFTGAKQTKKGLFELAHGGTLFLDEIEALSPTIQVKLLRVLETRSFTRLGDTRQRVVVCRLCCAANVPLRGMVAEGRIRDDLYQRLSSFLITLPPLRERRQDLPLLVHAFINEANRRLGRRVQGITPDALAMLHEYSWSGNVRELRNVIERAIILTEDCVLIDKAVFPSELFSLSSVAQSPILPLKELEKQHIETVLSSCRGNQSLAAKCLGISRTTLHKKLRDFALH